MNIDGDVIANINSRREVVGYLGRTDTWLARHTAPQTPAQEIRNALVARYNALSNINIPVIVNAHVGQRGNYDVLDKNAIAVSLSDASEAISVATANSPLQSQVSVRYLFFSK